MFQPVYSIDVSYKYGDYEIDPDDEDVHSNRVSMFKRELGILIERHVQFSVGININAYYYIETGKFSVYKCSENYRRHLNDLLLRNPNFTNEYILKIE